MLYHSREKLFFLTKKIKFKFQLFKKNFGLGKAFRSGTNLASGSHVMFIPTDNYHPSKGLIEILEKIKWNDDILLSYVKSEEVIKYNESYNA